MKLAAYFLFKGDVKLPLIITRRYDMSGGCPPRRRPDNFVRWKERKPLARTIILEGTPISAGADVDK